MEKLEPTKNQELNQDLKNTVFEEVFLDNDNNETNTVKVKNKINKLDIDKNTDVDKCNRNVNPDSSSTDNIDNISNIKLNNDIETKNQTNHIIDNHLQNDKNHEINLNNDRIISVNNEKIKENIKLLSEINNQMFKTKKIDKYGGICVEISECLNSNSQNNSNVDSNKLTELNKENNKSSKKESDHIKGMDSITGNFIRDDEYCIKQLNDIIKESKKKTQSSLQDGEKLSENKQTINSVEARSLKRGVYIFIKYFLN